VTTTQGTPNEAAQAPSLRASDVDRLATVRVLQDAVGRGLLTPDEGGDRMAAAFAAVHVDELAPLTADLPSGRAVAPGWRPLAMMAVEQVRSSLHAPSSRRLAQARVVLAVLVVVTLLVLIGWLVAELFFDGGGDFDGDGFDGDGFRGGGFDGGGFDGDEFDPED
jgi:hypothetical protein